MNLMDIVQIIKDVLIGFAAAYSAWQGGRALNQWRTEMIGKDKYKIAKDLSVKALDCAERLHFVRMSFQSNEEVENLQKSKTSEGLTGKYLPADPSVSIIVRQLLPII